MLVLTVRTDNPEAEVGLFEDGSPLSLQSWLAHRKLSVQLPGKITDVLQSHGKSLANLNGIVVFQGPGSFTGLRIGLTIANALAYGRRIPIVATMGDGWIKTGIERLQAGEDDRITLPHYGAEAHITLPKR